MENSVLYTACDVATMQPGGEPYGLIRDAGIAVADGRVVWVGAARECPAQLSALHHEPLAGALVTPALIDCHTHLVFGGNRAAEFEQRLQGASYEDIARSGGGILSTVAATRGASDEQLTVSALRRLDALLAEGVGVVEIKSGYGLTIEDELRMLRVARSLASRRPVKVVTTWLAAHAVPPEYTGRADAYVDDVVIPGMRRALAEGLVDAVDGFCETIAFSRNEMARVFAAARALGLPVKLHAEQRSDQKGAVLAAECGALSADHLEYLAPEDVAVLADAGTVAVLLPAAFYTLRETQPPPVAALRSHGVPIAIATDCNPGSAPLSSLLTAVNMACTLYGLTPEEALCGATRTAAQALGLSSEYGRIATGCRAEFAVWDAEHPRELAYWIDGPGLSRRISHPTPMRAAQ